MGAGASAQPEADPEEPKPQALPTRREACDASFATLQGMVTRSGVGFARARDVNDRSFDLKGGVLWCDSRGIYVGRHRHQQAAAVAWSDNITFSTKKDGLMICGDTTQWRVELNGKSEVAAWLACYLHAFAPITDYTQTVTFTEWGQLGIAFGVFMKRVIPVVFTVEGAALSNNVRPASELVSVNGRKVEALGDEDDLPHGVFQPSDYPRARYHGTALLVPRLDVGDLKVMTNDAYSKVKLPWSAGQAAAA